MLRGLVDLTRLLAEKRVREMNAFFSPKCFVNAQNQGQSSLIRMRAEGANAFGQSKKPYIEKRAKQSIYSQTIYREVGVCGTGYSQWWWLRPKNEGEAAT
jgi:hypothetical protein